MSAVQDKSRTGNDPAFVTTEANPEMAEAIERCSAWHTSKTEPSTADMTAKLRRSPPTPFAIRPREQ
jgi:hypothetical protein